MAQVPVCCPVCGSENVVKNGKHKNGSRRFRCDNPDCERKYFQLDYAYNACKPGTKRQIIDMAMNGSGTRDTARVLGIGRNTVTRTLKKTSIESSECSSDS